MKPIQLVSGVAILLVIIFAAWLALNGDTNVGPEPPAVPPTPTPTLSEKILGEWYISDNVNDIMRFNGDGTYISGSILFEDLRAHDAGTYAIDGTMITFTISKESFLCDEGQYSETEITRFDENEFDLVVIEDTCAPELAGEMFTLVRCEIKPGETEGWSVCEPVDSE